MSFMLDAPGGRGKNEWTRRFTFTDWQSKLLLLALAKGHRDIPAHSNVNYSVLNNHISDEDLRAGRVFMKIGDTSVATLQEVEAELQAHPVSVEDLAPIIKSGSYFVCNANKITNTVLCSAYITSLLMNGCSVSVQPLVFGTTSFNVYVIYQRSSAPDDIAIIIKAIVTPYDLLLNGDVAVRGLPAVIWEGVTKPTCGYVNPRVTDGQTHDALTGAKVRVDNQAAVALARLLIHTPNFAQLPQRTRELLVTRPSHFLDKAVMKALKVKSGDLVVKERTYADLVSDVMELRQLSQSLPIDSRVQLDPFRAFEDDKTCTWLDRQQLIATITCHPVFFLLNLRGSCIFDSMLSLLWMPGTGGLTKGGANVNVFDWLIETTYMPHIILRAPIGDGPDPFVGVDVTPLLTGGLNFNFGNGDHLGNECLFTSRQTRRHTIHRLTGADEATKIAVSPYIANLDANGGSGESDCLCVHFENEEERCSSTVVRREWSKDNNEVIHLNDGSTILTTATDVVTSCANGPLGTIGD